MSLFAEAFAWILDPANWAGPDGIAAQLWFHLVFSLAIVATGIPAYFLFRRRQHEAGTGTAL